jgi:hypothetical protein
MEIKCRLDKKGISVVALGTPFDYAQGDGQTERSQSLDSLTKRQ